MSKKIVVAGAGIGGLCAALALTNQGFHVEVFEQSSALGEVGAGLQLSPNAMHVLQSLGVSERVKKMAFCPSAAVMRHYQTGKPYFTVPLADNMLQRYGADYLHIHRADLHTVLYQACIDKNVSVHLGEAVAGYSLLANQVNVLLDNGHDCVADVLIGADGIKSNVQTCMLGEQPAQFTGQVAWRGVIEAAKLPRELIKPNANLWVGPGQHFVSYYLRGGELVNFVAVQERNDWRDESWHQKGDVRELQHAFAGWHPEVTELLAATQSCFLWALFDRQPLDQWVDGNVGLLGDACHPMLPFLAQGAAMAIEDSYALAHCLAKSDNPNVALNTYQGLRQQRTKVIQHGARKNANLYHMSSFMDRTKLNILLGLSAIGLGNNFAASKLNSLYAYNITERLGRP